MNQPMMDAPPSCLRIVSNRLPVTIDFSREGPMEVKPSSGGLISCLAPLRHAYYTQWYGWTGSEVPDRQRAEVERLLDDDHSATAVHIDQKSGSMHYNGFSNTILWQLLHSRLPNQPYDLSVWKAHVEVNERFAETIVADLNNGDTVWIHDYHLMLLPTMIRRRLHGSGKDVRIGWFLHTPFPSNDIWCTLPQSSVLLEGVLGADLIGFHIPEYLSNFQMCCKQALKAKNTCDSIIYQNRRIRVGDFPAGIDPSHFNKVVNRVDRPGSKDNLSLAANRKTIVACDRLDPVKGILHKLRAFETFLEQHPEWIGKAQLVQVVIPSREDCTDYIQLKKDLNELVGHINGRFGEVGFNPVHLKHMHMKQDDFVRLLRSGDACMISSVRDGMNLISLEFVACQKERHGVVILSEFAGSAKILGNGALLHNPYNLWEASAMILRALEMTSEEKKLRYEAMSYSMHASNSKKWGRSFVDRLLEC